MTQKSACAKWSFLPHHLHRLCSGEKPSTYVVPGYPGHLWLLPWQPQPIGTDHSMESLMRTGSGPRGLRLPRTAPPVDSLGGNQGHMGQCPGKQVFIQHARCGIFLPLPPRMACTQVAKLLLKKLFFKPSSPYTHSHTQITFAFKKKKKIPKPKLNSHHLM